MNALVARDRLRRDDALMARLVRQPRRSGDVADRPDALDICAAIGIGIDMALGRFDAELFQPDILGVGQDADRNDRVAEIMRSEEHTSELQSLMRISYAVCCLKKQKNNTTKI